MEKILEDISFNASEMKAKSEIVIDAKYVTDHLGDLISSKNDLMKFVLQKNNILQEELINIFDD